MTDHVVDQPPPCPDHQVSWLTCGPCRVARLAHYEGIMASEEYLRPAPPQYTFRGAVGRFGPGLATGDADAVYRVGRHQPRNVYRGDEYIGVMFAEEDAALVVSAMNMTLVQATAGYDVAQRPDWWTAEHEQAALDGIADQRRTRPAGARRRPDGCMTCHGVANLCDSTCMTRSETPS